MSSSSLRIIVPTFLLYSLRTGFSWQHLAICQALDILIPLGKYFQVQDGFLDIFGDPSVIGNIGTDIQDNKCSWLVNQAILCCSPQQRAVLDESYSRRDKMNVRREFGELDIQGAFRDFEDKRIQELQRLIEAVDERDGLHKKVFTVFLSKICQRSNWLFI